MSILKKLKSRILDMDIYGHPIAVHFKGSTTHKTWFGVVCTLLIYITVT